MTDRRGNVSRSYFNRLLRQELVNVENDLHGNQIDDEADDTMVQDGIDADFVDEAAIDLDDGNVGEDNVIIGGDYVEAEHDNGLDSDDGDGEDIIIDGAGQNRYESDSDDENVRDIFDDLDDLIEIDNEGVGYDDDAEIDSLKKKLAKLVIKNKWSRDSVNELLLLLRENGHEELPKTRETLLHTPSIPIVPRVVHPGEYYHVGLKKCLKRCNYEFLTLQDFIEIDISIDGLSLSKSSKLKTWPILGAFPNKPDTSPFIIGTYVGYENPESIDDFLFDFIVEAQDALDNGVEVTPHLRSFLTGTFTYLANIGS